MSGTLAELRQQAVKAQQDGQSDVAGRLYAQYLAQKPQDAGIWSNLGILFRRQGRHTMALRAQERAFALAPQDLGIRNNLANILSDTGSYDRSISMRRDILREHPDDASQKAMIGRCLRGQGNYAAAISHLSKVIPEHPDDPELQIQLAFAQLGAGDYAAGLTSYKARWRAGELQPRDLPFPEWNGEDLTGKRIVVLPEQGFGDAVLFARFLPVLAGTGAHVSLVVARPLQRLFADIAGVDEIIPELTRSTPADYWVNMMDLAALYFARDAAVPAPPVLTIPEAAQRRAEALIAPHHGRFRVGVVWTGSVTYKGNAFRSFTHNEFLPLADIPGVQLFSLYKGPALAAYYAEGADAFMLDAGATETDFADCAGMMKALDLVITSDTATAHIAGALGVPAWVVLHWDAFWVWRHSGKTTAWYPGLQLYRQQEPLDWLAVMDQVAQDLRKKVESGS